MSIKTFLSIGFIAALSTSSVANQTIVAYGDSRTNADQHLQVVTALGKFNTPCCSL